MAKRKPKKEKAICGHCQNGNRCPDIIEFTGETEESMVALKCGYCGAHLYDKVVSNLNGIKLRSQEMARRVNESLFTE